MKEKKIGVKEKKIGGKEVRRECESSKIEGKHKEYQRGSEENWREEKEGKIGENAGRSERK